MQPRHRVRDQSNERAVNRRAEQQVLDRKLLTGTLLDTMQASAAGPRGVYSAASHRSPSHGKMPAAASPQLSISTSPMPPRSTLQDAVEAYLQDRGIINDDGSANDVLPEQKDFVKRCIELNQSLISSRDMYRDAPNMIAQKQAALRASVERAKSKIPMNGIDSLQDHFAFEDYQDYLREIGCLDDEPNFSVNSTGNLEPILSVLYDEAVQSTYRFRRVVRTINGYEIMEEIDDGFAHRASLEEADSIYKITTKPKATQTDVNVNDKSLLGEITAMASEIAQLQEVLRSQEKRLTMWDVFRDTVVKRMVGVMEEARAMQQAKEQELNRILDLLVSAVRQNEVLANKLSAVTLPGGSQSVGSAAQQQGAPNESAPEEAGLTYHQVIEERKKVATSFASLLTRARKQRYAMEERCEKLEMRGLAREEMWSRRLAKAQRDIETLHRGFLEGPVKGAIDECEAEVKELTLAGHGGLPLVNTFQTLGMGLPADLHRALRSATDTAFQQAEASSVYMARVMVDAVRNGHKPTIVADSVRRAPRAIGELRDILARFVVSVKDAFVASLAAAESAFRDEKVDLQARWEETLADSRKELAAERKSQAVRDKLKHRHGNPDFTRDVEVTAIEELIDADLAAAHAAAGEAYRAPKKKAKAAPSTGSNATAGGETGPPKSKPKGKMYSETKLSRATTDDLKTCGIAFVRELIEEVSDYARHFKAPVPTRIDEAGYLIDVLKTLSVKCADNENTLASLQGSLSRVAKGTSSSAFATEPSFSASIEKPSTTGAPLASKTTSQSGLTAEISVDPLELSDTASETGDQTPLKSKAKKKKKSAGGSKRAAGSSKDDALLEVSTLKRIKSPSRAKNVTNDGALAANPSSGGKAKHNRATKAKVLEGSSSLPPSAEEPVDHAPLLEASERVSTAVPSARAVPASREQRDTETLPITTTLDQPPGSQPIDPTPLPKPIMHILFDEDESVEAFPRGPTSHTSRRGSLSTHYFPPRGRRSTEGGNGLGVLVERLHAAGGHFHVALEGLLGRGSASLSVESVVAAILDVSGTSRANRRTSRSASPVHSTLNSHRGSGASTPALIVTPRKGEHRAALEAEQAMVNEALVRESHKRQAAEDFASGLASDLASVKRKLLESEGALSREKHRVALMGGARYVLDEGVCPHCKHHINDAVAGDARHAVAHDTGVLDPREAVRLMSRSRAQQADGMAARCLHSRGLTPVAILKRPPRKAEPATPPPQTHDMDSRSFIASSTPQPAGRRSTLCQPAGISVNRLQGKYTKEAPPLPHTPLQIMRDRYATPAIFPIIGPTKAATNHSHAL
jgi:Txe/YoeB family toxin of Txe-Axe toxin-antitoxin module